MYLVIRSWREIKSLSSAIVSFNGSAAIHRWGSQGERGMSLFFISNLCCFTDILGGCEKKEEKNPTRVKVKGILLKQNLVINISSNKKIQDNSTICSTTFLVSGINAFLYSRLAQSARAVEYADCISAEGVRPPPLLMSVQDMTLNNLMVRVQ